ncbi:MAG: hypothetical protein KF784_09370 [Fimbriimonadaceae bacterium]|nr:hypothetical protein [Fimbriimonadaceae bacterium]
MEMYFALTEPNNWFEPMLLPLIASIFGGLMYFVGAMKERDGAKSKAKWVGVGICGLGVFLGFSPFWTWVSSSPESEIYRSMYHGRKMMIGHLGSLLMPLIVILVAVGHHFIAKWRNRVFEE